MDGLQNNRAPLLGFIKFVHYFKAIIEFKLELQSGNAQFRSKLAIFFIPVDIEFRRMILKTIGHLFYATSNFLHHFLAICELKLELRPGNTQKHNFYQWQWLLQISWWYDNGNIVQKVWQTDRQTETDRRTDGQKDWTIHRAAWSQLKNKTNSTII